MLEFGNVTRLNYAASVITSASAASDPDELDTEMQETIDYLVDPKTHSFYNSATGANEAISQVQEALQQTVTIGGKLGSIKQYLAELAKESLADGRSAYLIHVVEEEVSLIDEAIQQTDFGGNLFLGSDGKDLLISIGHGSSITVESQDLSLNGGNLTSAEGIEAFLEAVNSRLDAAAAEEDHLGSQLNRLENATQIIEYPTEGEAGDGTELDQDKAMAVASLAANSAIENLSVLFSIQDNLDNETAAALLADPAM